MSKAIPVENLPSAIIGAQVVIPRDKLRELRAAGQVQEEVDAHLSKHMYEAIKSKHEKDLEIIPIDGAFNSSGRIYRLEIVTFSRPQLIAHYAEWAQLEAERDMYKAELEKIKNSGYEGMRP